jgi:hypothetical protein
LINQTKNPQNFYISILCHILTNIHYKKDINLILIFTVSTPMRFIRAVSTGDDGYMDGRYMDDNSMKDFSMNGPGLPGAWQPYWSSSMPQCIGQ